MKLSIFDHHVHMDSRSANDYESMALVGVESILIPCTFTGEHRRRPDDFFRYYDRLLNFERKRAAAFGMSCHLALSVYAGDVADPVAAQETVEALPEYLGNESVLAVGELGFNHFSDAEEELFRAQLRLAQRHRLPAIIEAPWRHGQEALQRVMGIIRQAISEDDVDPGKLLMVDLHADTLPIAWELQLGGYGVPVAPRQDRIFAIHRKADATEVQDIVRNFGDDRIMLNSALHFGVGDPMGIARVLLQLRQTGVSFHTLQKLASHNASTLLLPA
uniref:TatD DNase family protein n=1 Tax=Candidatus Kentrum sp. MB TaxID=2138164 RepID=A0A450XK07_9GAMM|nr:MAG: hypothetical protein BECKMB1821G_GA0114241_101515 [Candidatus Kentron sp. MB]VFK29642.1 MAG: hypothetical protein BECKMB1821I_GA0114274_101114 [Candidatus Kentron sp. MB]VFK74851.1 MAG: hypothetical protein BECKMB1821H_GA0114242_101114 [Candidatus Kentron sp. MB]